MNHDNAWALIQEDIKNKNLIFSVKVTNSSYLRIGGYNARPYSLKLGIGERLRPAYLYLEQVCLLALFLRLFQ